MGRGKRLPDIARDLEDMDPRWAQFWFGQREETPERNPLSVIFPSVKDIKEDRPFSFGEMREIISEAYLPKNKSVVEEHRRIFIEDDLVYLALLNSEYLRLEKIAAEIEQATGQKSALRSIDREKIFSMWSRSFVYSLSHYLKQAPEKRGAPPSWSAIYLWSRELSADNSDPVNVAWREFSAELNAWRETDPEAFKAFIKEEAPQLMEQPVYLTETLSPQVKRAALWTMAPTLPVILERVQDSLNPSPRRFLHLQSCLFAEISKASWEKGSLSNREAEDIFAQTLVAVLNEWRNLPAVLQEDTPAIINKIDDLLPGDASLKTALKDLGANDLKELAQGADIEEIILDRLNAYVAQIYR